MRTLRRGSVEATAALLLMLAAGCSGSDRGDDDDDGGSGGSGGGGRGPAGAVSLEMYATAEQTCPPGNVHIDLGNVNAAPPVTIADGEDGAEVRCAVVPAGSDLDASGSLAQGAIVFSLAEVVTDGGSATGLVSVQDPASGVRYASPAISPCVFQFAPGTDQGIAPGRLWVQFDCASLVSEANPADSCSARYGYVLLEGCEGG